MANPWEMNWGGDPVIAPPDPYKQAGEQRAQRDQSLQETTTALQNQLTQMQIEEKRTKAAEEAKAAETAAGADATARDKLIRLIGQLSGVGVDADDNSGWFETGTSGSFSRSALPAGTAGFDLQKDVDTLGANFAFDALQAMRDASKTGGALGQVTERELDLLKSSVGNIDPNQSHGNFLKNIETVRQAYLAKLAMIDPQEAARLGYDAAKAEQAVRSLADEYAKSLGTTADVTVKNEQPVSGWGKAQVVD